MTPEVATPKTGMMAPVASLPTYWRVTGVLLGVVALWGIVVAAMQGNNAWWISETFLRFDWTHNVVHVLLAGTALYFGFMKTNEATSRMAAKVLGIVYLALGVLGFIPAVTTLLADTLMLHLEATENVIHLVVGAWGAYVGFSK